MGYYTALRIGASGLTAQRLRTDIIANNIANQNTTRTVEGGPYRRQQVVFGAHQVSTPFQAILLRHGVFGVAAAAPAPVTQGVRVVQAGPDGKPPRRVLEPDNPDADAEGFVEYPDIDPVTEMTDLLSATRAYEANVTVVNAAKSMALKALEIGR